jgi:class 3 adenylate cyclase
VTPLERVLRAAVNSVMSAPWSVRLGRVVPAPQSIILGGGAVDLECTILYADLAESSNLASNFDRRVAAKAIKAFITCATRIINHQEGTVVSFDGDRVMGVFTGRLKNAQAAQTGLKLNFAMKNILAPRVAREFATLNQAGFSLRHACGIDTGVSLAIRTGMREINDLVWIGRAANLAARMSAIREDGFATYISAAVYSDLPEWLKFNGPQADAVWERRTLKWGGENLYVYRTSHGQAP